MATNLTWAQRTHRRGHIGMAISNVCLTAAAVFFVIGIALLLATGNPVNVVTILMAGVIATNALSIRRDAKDMLRIAARIH